MISTLDFLDYDFMQRALVAALLVGVSAPATGIFLVQRRLSLIGDGLGHVAVTGIALGLLLGQAPTAVALITAVAGALLVELIRARQEAFAEVALAMLFYGGIAGGVVLASRSPSGGRSLNQYLFGSIATTSTDDLVVVALLAATVLVVTVVIGPALFAVSDDAEFAAASGMPVVLLNVSLAVLSALTVVISMRIIGVLLVSALMVVPVATAQLFTNSFRDTYLLGVGLGAATAISGVTGSFYLDTPSGGTIVLLSIAIFALASTVVGFRSGLRSRSQPETRNN